MASGGARGPTQAEMVRVLHLDGLKLAATHASFGKLLATLNGRNGADGVELRVANRFWGQVGYPFESGFEHGLASALGVD